MTEDLQFMARAIRLAEKGRYSTHPNPAVGCVLVRQGKVVGEGYHIKAGEGHAEARALARAGSDAEGATAYVTLEPCSFRGRTPSCARALVAAKVKKVVVATLDPDSRNSGNGLQILRDAGIEVVTPVMEESAKALIRGHIKRYIKGRPFVRLKMAMTLDGKTALANGESKWITSDAARLDVQKLRARSGAIVTGVQTVIDDDPQMSVRELPDHPHAKQATDLHRPVYILDSALRIPRSARLLQEDSTVLVTCNDAEGSDLGRAEVLNIQEDGGRVALAPFLSELARREHSDVLFECGATLAGSLISQKLVDEVVVYMAPRIIGADGRSLLNLPEIDRMSALVDLVITDIRQVGQDLKLTATLAD